MKAARRVTLLRSIGSSVDRKCAETIYITMILLTFTRCGSLGPVWSDTRKSPIKNIEQRSLRIILGNKGLKVSSIENTIKCKRGQLVFESPQKNVFSPFKSYIERFIILYTKQRFSSKIVLSSLLGKTFYYLKAELFNEVSTGRRSLTSRLSFTGPLTYLSRC